MADLTSLVKDYAVPIGRFLKGQFDIWLEVVDNPLGVISKIDLDARKSLESALLLTVFTYVLTMLIAVPKMIKYVDGDVLDTSVILPDFVLTFIRFCLLGLTFHGAGKALAGHGRLKGSMIAGFYLTAYWPILQFIDHFSAPSPRHLDAYETGVLRLIVFLVIIAIVLWIALRKVRPVMAHVHGLGTVGSTIAVLLQALLMFAFRYLFIESEFLQSAGAG